MVVVRDITQLKETQQLLQTSEEKFAKAFHASPDGLLLSRQSDGLLIEVNEGFSRLTGYTSATSLDQSALELGIWVNLNERKHMLELMQRDGFVRDFICHIRRSDGQIRLCEVSSRPLPIAGEDCMLTIARDITERHLMQEKLQQAGDGIREHCRRRTDHRYPAAHQRRQPRVHRNHRLQRKRSPRPYPAPARFRPA